MKLFLFNNLLQKRLLCMYAGNMPEKSFMPFQSWMRNLTTHVASVRHKIHFKANSSRTQAHFSITHTFSDLKILGRIENGF